MLALACIANARSSIDRDGRAPLTAMYAWVYQRTNTSFFYEYQRLRRARAYLPATGRVGFVGPDGMPGAGYVRIFTVAQYALAPLHVLPILPEPYRPPIYTRSLQLPFDAYVVDTRSRRAAAWLAAHPSYRVTAHLEPELRIVVPPRRP